MSVVKKIQRKTRRVDVKTGHGSMYKPLTKLTEGGKSRRKTRAKMLWDHKYGWKPKGTPA